MRRVDRASAAWWGALLVVLTIAVAVAGGNPLGTRAAEPVTRTWTGEGANNNWNTGANWDSGVPVEGDILVFPAAAARKTNVNNFPAGTSFSEIHYDGGGYSVTGNRVVVSDALTNDAAGGINTLSLVIDGEGELQVDAGTLQLLGTNLYTGGTMVNGGTVFAANSAAFGAASSAVELTGGTISLANGVVIPNALTIGGAGVPVLTTPAEAEWAGSVTLTGLHSFTIGPAALLLISGSVVGTANLQKDGLGHLFLSGANAYSGITDINQGTLRALSDTALGTNAGGTFVAGGATLELGNVDLGSEAITIAGDGVASNGALRAVDGLAIIDSLVLDGPVRIGADGGTLRIEAGIPAQDEGEDIVKVGAGRVEVMGASSFANAVYVSQGEFAVLATLPASIFVNGGTLTGDGTISELVALIGTVKPGVDGAGVLNVTGDIDLADGTTLVIGIESSTVNASLQATGSINIDGAILDLEGAGAASADDEFKIIQNDGPGAVVGTFDGLPEGSEIEHGTRTFEITYAAAGTGDVVLIYTGSTLEETDLSVTVVPLPATWPKNSQITVRYELRNLGPGTAGTLTVNFPIHEGLRLDEYDIPDPWTCTAPDDGLDGTLECTREDWEPTETGEPVVLEARFTVLADTGETVIFDAAVVYEGDDPDQANQSDSETVEVVAPDARPFKLRLPELARDGLN